MRAALRIFPLLLLTASLWGQQLQPSAPVADHRIVLDVTVTDHTDHPIEGLKRSDFTLLDNKKPQTMTSFQEIGGASGAAVPVRVYLLIDEVNTDLRTLSYEREEIHRFLMANDGKLAQPVSFIFFSDSGTQVLNGFSQDGHALSAAYDEHETKLRTLRRSAGFWGAEERFELSMKTLGGFAAQERTVPGRKLLIWISPGWAYLSGPHIYLSGKEQESLFHTIVAVSNSLQQARITLSSVDPLGTLDAGGFRTSYYKEFLKGVSSPHDAEAGSLSLQVLATQSGGRVLNANNDTYRLIAEAMADANHFYEITYDAPPSDKTNEYHSIQVQLSQPGATVLTRTGYYAQP